MITAEVSYEKLYRQFEDKELFVYRNDQGYSDSLTGRMLEHKVLNLGGRLQKLLKPRERAMIILPQGLEYIYSILACFYANVTAIPTSVISIVSGTEINEKTMPVLMDSQAKCIITDTNFKQQLDGNPAFANVSVLNIDELDEVENKRPRKRKPEDIAIILYTSGSTAQPKGVMLTHANVASQAMAGAEQWDIRQESRIVSWMPQFHNFGLFFNIMAPLLKGAASVILPPDSFIRSPHFWLEMMGRYQATHTAAPNFAFDYCCSSIQADDVKGLSLRSLQAIICGGEAVRKETYEHFFESFQKLGLKEHIFSPHYGMSEMGSASTLRPGQPIRFLLLDIQSLEKGIIALTDQTTKSKSVISCGEIDDDARIVCVNGENGRLCLSDEVGEIWIKSPSITAGYLNQPEETGKTFGGTLEESGETGFFRTGDLGFIRDKHLYIIGREKEVIIVHGKNHHPVDIEWTVKKNLPELTLPLCVFSTEVDGVEKVIVVQEITAPLKDAEYKRISRAIIGCVSETHGLEAYQVYLVLKGAIPRTGSGKIQRKNCRSLYREDKLPCLYPNRKDAVLQVGAVSEVPSITGQNDVQDIIKILINDVFQVVLNRDPQELEVVTSFSELGFDSMKYVRVSKRIEEVFQIPFAPVMLFKYRSIEKLAQYLSTQIERTEAVAAPIPDTEAAASAEDVDSEDKGIAVIGISCHFPGEAASPRLFWENILQGKECITAISDSRPQVIEDYRRMYGDSSELPPKWGGFIQDVDRFDAAFFGISPLEAESMDPQQRKLLELTWSVLEDGGYDPTELAGSDVGLFMGAHSNDYAELIAKDPNLMDIYGAYLDSGLHMSMITHRVSRWFNFHGPSEIVNTACSSSLVAIHHAMEAVYRGECSMAIAGGINLILSSRIYTASHKAGMLSVDGHCKTFDEQADGFVRAEGYGAILLKPYKEALKDNDTIYGIIRGAAINHDGQSNSLRAPNLNAQKRLIMSAYAKSGIPVNTISFIEAHGTGTSLGDPIEFQALHEAFQDMGAKTSRSYCGLGTVKTAIGHCESAAGIAGVIKVLLSMKEQTLPGILHFKKLNPYIALEETPFYIVDKTRHWQRLTDDEGKEIPRRAGISSFGYGGANAHVIVEEYLPSIPAQKKPAVGQPTIVPISARNRDRLLTCARQLLDYLEKASGGVNISNLAYTLQVGRSAMEERAAFLVRDIWELKEKIGSFLEGKVIGGCWQGRVNKGKAVSRPLEGSEAVQENLEQIAEVWVQGGHMDWRSLYGNDKPLRMNLPTYPFTKARYWIPESDERKGYLSHGDAVEAIHPLLQRNTSDFTEQRFSTTLTGDEFFLSDHVVKGRRILPGVAYVEMARAALEQSSRPLYKGGYGVRMKEITWAQPLAVDKEPVQVHIALYPEENGQIEYVVYTGELEEHAEQIVHSHGRMDSGPVEASVLDLDRVRGECHAACLTSDVLYERFSRLGINYGPSHRGVKEILLGQGVALAKLIIPSGHEGNLDSFMLHPSMLDAALQATTALVNEKERLTLPFMVKELEIYAACRPTMWARITHRSTEPDQGRVDKFDIDLCDEGGHICVRITEFTVVTADKEFESVGNLDTRQTMMFCPEWIHTPVSDGSGRAAYDEHVLVLLEPDQDFLHEVSSVLKGIRLVVMQDQELDLDHRFEAYALKLMEELQGIVTGRSPCNVFIQLAGSTEGKQKALMGLAAMLRTACLENPHIVGQTIGFDSWKSAAPDRIMENSCCPEVPHIRYEDGKRLTLTWNSMHGADGAPGELWKHDGVYLITGGMGGLGLLFAQEIVRHADNPTLVLIGRSMLDAHKEGQLQQLREHGARVEYEIVNAAHKESIQRLINSMIARYGKLNGIIHSAGLIRDSYILKKTAAELKEVLAVKVRGLMNLDEACESLPLDFLITCSSIAGSLGNPGQADYAAANAFMDYYASYRNELVAWKRRSGRTLSVNWPLWEEGGMHVSTDIKRMMLEHMGMSPMKTKSGMETLYRGFASGQAQVMVIEGYEDRIRAYIKRQTAGIPVDHSVHKPAPPASSSISSGVLGDKAIHYFKNLLSSVMRMSAHEIDADQPMEKYGIDSIMIIQLTEQLEKVFGPLPKTLFFEYRNIQALARYFLEVFQHRMVEVLGLKEETVQPEGIAPTSNANQVIEIPALHEGRRKRARFSSVSTDSSKGNAVSKEDIAIIGLAGRYPGAGNVHEFWNNLSQGRDCITEIPPERWDHSRYFDRDKNAAGKTYTKWGGFLEGVDRFDPLFFNISPKEAELMDPQERLFLECVHEAIEDAGYSRNNLGKRRNGGQDGNVGVFVGVMFEEYQLYGAQRQLQGNPIAVSGTIASIANRVSYYYDLHGPSMTVDTMCSSSLTALHLACQSLQTSGCELAIAGGVNISIHPNKYLLLAQGKFASSKGRCETFGQGGDGYVPGEGVGAVVLKHLSKAVEDGDHIFGVIKATAINHGGKTNGYTVPNPNAQANVIGQALDQAGIDPRSITYLEAHGTGTSLGDPIEIAGLTKAFQKYTRDTQFCAIGSVKSNIGHCEGAAGIAGVTKILMQMKHGQLAPSLHSEVLNPNIDFPSTPFIVQQELAEWKRLVLASDGSVKEYPRRAGISAFGAGGSNAHIVIEEYAAPTPTESAVTVSAANLAVIVLSAKSGDQLREVAKRLLAAIQERMFSDSDLANMAYTLQIGREALEERLAMTAASLGQLENRLTAFLENEGGSETMYRGSVKGNNGLGTMLRSDEDLQNVIQSWMTKKKYEKLLELWVTGVEVDWEFLYLHNKPSRISLPAYPFARERYWLPEIEAQGEGTGATGWQGPGSLHPLLHRNTSNLEEQRFTSTFTGGEFFFRDHVVKGMSLLPGTAYLEMARAAIVESVPIREESLVTLGNIVWARPFAVNGTSPDVHIGIYPEEDGELSFTVYSVGADGEDETVVHCQGRGVMVPAGRVQHPERLDIGRLQTVCRQTITGRECYEIFRSMGIDYGSGHRGIETIYAGEDQALARLVLPEAVRDGAQEYILHPGMLDSAIQATIGLSLNNGSIPKLPFALEELEVLGACAETMWAVISKNHGVHSDDKMQMFDIDLCDESGKILVRMKKFAVRALGADRLERPRIGVIMMHPVWKESSIVQ